MNAYLSSSEVEACMTVVLPAAAGTVATLLAAGGSRPTTVDVRPRCGPAWSDLPAGGSLPAKGGGGGGGGRSLIRQLNRDG